MCGIFGYISNMLLPDDKLFDSLRHRGPDHHAKYHTFLFDKHIVLGHTRLSIIDLSEKGNQPMHGQNDRIHISYNGELYNQYELKKKHFGNRRFISGTDTEVFLAQYEKFGIRGLRQLNGDFAACILDEEKNKLFLIRDRMGVKPLYYHKRDGNIIFASEIRALLAAGVRPQLNEEALENYFVFKYSPGNETLFQHIKRVPPGCYLEIDLANQTASTISYWHLSKNSLSLSYRDAQQRLIDLLKDSVQLRLMAEVPIGNFLSGGLDSSIIAYFLKDRKEIRHYCAVKSPSDIRKEGTTPDQHFAGMLAERWDLHLTTTPLDAHMLSDEMFTEITKHNEDLIADGSLIPSWLICKQASAHSKVMLSGMGADELFLGYAAHQLAALKMHTDKWPDCIKSPFYHFLSSLKPGKGPFKPYKRWLQKLGKYAGNGNISYGLFSLVGDYANALSVLKHSDRKSASILHSYFDGKKDVFDALWHFETENFLVKNLHYTDRMAMAHSVEVRVPFLDHRLVSFAYNLPLAYKMKHANNTKRILKDAFTGKIPAAVIRRRKAGFGMPLRSIFSDSSHSKKLIDLDFFSNFNYFHTDHIRQMMIKHKEGSEDNSSLIFALIVFKYWYKEYINH